MIIGIDDHLTNVTNNIDSIFIKFKKYYQKIIFDNDFSYKKWLKNDDKNNIQVHIFGHSFGKTDYEVLYEIFNTQNLDIIVYYYSNKNKHKIIQKVINLLSYKGDNGENELNKRISSKDNKIEFVDQYDENEGLFIHPDKRKYLIFRDSISSNFPSSFWIKLFTFIFS
jgi:hypothetical protein